MVARVGVPVTFDASTSAVAAPGKQAPGSIDRLHLAIADGSPADERGIQPNDVIDMVGRTPVKDAGSFARLLNEQRKLGRPVVLSVTNADGTRFVTLRLDK